MAVVLADQNQIGSWGISLGLASGGVVTATHSGTRRNQFEYSPVVAHSTTGRSSGAVEGANKALHSHL